MEIESEILSASDSTSISGVFSCLKKDIAGRVLKTRKLLGFVVLLFTVFVHTYFYMRSSMKLLIDRQYVT